MYDMNDGPDDPGHRSEYVNVEGIAELFPFLKRYLPFYYAISGALALCAGVSLIALSFLFTRGATMGRYVFWFIGAVLLYFAWRAFARARRKWRQNHDPAR